jgi:hypothetical protein
MTFPRHQITQLLTNKKCNKFGIYLDHEIWVAADGVIIRLPKGNRIHIDIVELICLELLNMSMWEYDYWLGQVSVQS